MPTIKARRQANGITRYTAIVRLRRHGKVLHREVALEDPAELTRQKQSTPTLAELIRWYIDTFETISP